MTDVEFEFEMQRMNENFKNFYSRTKRKVIANIVSDIPIEFFSKCVEKVMWADKPPKIEWFQQLVSSYKKRQLLSAAFEDLGREKNSVFTESDISMMHEFYRRRLNGQLTDEQWYDFIECIREMVARGKSEIKCPTCLDRGWAVIRNVGMQKCPKGCVEMENV
jgi:hypothetical protein